MHNNIIREFPFSINENSNKLRSFIELLLQNGTMDYTRKIYCFFFFIICSFSLFAQEFGSVQGGLKDEFSGDPIANAKLTLFIDEAIVSQSNTDKLGNFSIWNIEQGVYELVISKMHFSTLKITDISITTNQQLTFNPLFEGKN